MNANASALMLASMLDLRAVASLRTELETRSGAPIDIDASQVERVGGLCLQQLLAAAAAWRDAGLAFRVVNPSQAFQEDLARLGAELVPGSDAPC